MQARGRQPCWNLSVDGLAHAGIQRYLKSSAWAIRKNASYRRHTRECVASGYGFSFTTSCMTRSAMSRIGTWFPFVVPTMSMPTGASVEAVQRSSSRDVGAVRIGRARQARHRKYRQLLRWLMARLGRRRSDHRFERDFRRQMLASSAAVALSHCHFIVLLFDTTRIR